MLFSAILRNECLELVQNVFGLLVGEARDCVPAQKALALDPMTVLAEGQLGLIAWRRTSPCHWQALQAEVRPRLLFEVLIVY